MLDLQGGTQVIPFGLWEELVLIFPLILFLKSILIYYDGNVIYLIIYQKEKAGIHK